MSEPLHTEDVETKTTYEKLSGRPFASTKPDLTPASLGITTENPYQYIKISKTHGRNMTEATASKKVIWGGPYSGDIYGDKNVKGSDMSEAHLEIGENGNYDVRARGLMDDISLLRTRKASEFLRKNGLPTEALRSVKTLKKVWIKDGEKWKKISVHKWEENELERIKNENPKFYEQFKTYLKETKFVVIERDVQVDERVEDIQLSCQKNDLRRTMQPIFKWLNSVTVVTNRGLISDTPKPEKFEVTNEGLKKYFGDYLPSQMGIYLGRLHRLGVAHGSSHNQNWSAVGTLYDADSVYGKPIFSDDEKPSGNAIDEDIFLSMSTLEDLALDLKGTDEFKGVDLKSLEFEVSYNFVLNYNNARFD